MITSKLKKMSGYVAVFALAAAALFVPVTSQSAYALECNDNDTSCVTEGLNKAKGNNVPDNLFSGDNVFGTIVNVLLFIIGAVSVIMLIWGGIRYTTSAGNAASVTSAKNTIMYAIIGLIIAFLAFAIVNWVLGAIAPTGATS